MLWLLAQVSPSATSTTAAKGSPITGLLPIVVLVGLFYFFMLRPQKRARMNQQMLLNQLAIGDQIETAAGMYGTITRTDDTTIWVELAPGFEVRMARGAVRRKIVPETTDPQGG